VGLRGCGHFILIELRTSEALKYGQKNRAIVDAMYDPLKRREFSKRLSSTRSRHLPKVHKNEFWK